MFAKCSNFGNEDKTQDDQRRRNKINFYFWIKCHMSEETTDMLFNITQRIYSINQDQNQYVKSKIVLYSSNNHLENVIKI